MVRFILSPITWFLFRGRCIGSANVPHTGPVILAPNHFSFFDHFFLAVFLRRKVRFMAKSQLFARPFQWIYFHGGVFPVRRGHHDEEAFITANTVLGRGGSVVMYCEGGRSRTGQLSEKAKRGIGRIALENGAPVVPIAIYGSQKARNWKRLQFPKVTVQYGEPMVFDRVAEPTREQQQAVADEVFARIRHLYAELERHGRKGMIQRVREQRRAERRDGRAATA
jgi:1-acyl-sn-glycerol-3-phosphate acyltransferase